MTARVEISALFTLKAVTDLPVISARIGGGVWIEGIDANWLDEVKKQCPKIEAREKIEPSGPYTHRWRYEVKADKDMFDSENLVTDDEKQPVLKALVLSRLVKPTSIGYDSVWVKSLYVDGQQVKHYHDQLLNN
jgi:hypothetical protein